MKKDFKAEIAKLVSDSEEMVDADEIESIIETPNDDANGDYALPCFTLAKKFRKSPNLIAEDLAEKLFKDRAGIRLPQLLSQEGVIHKGHLG